MKSERDFQAKLLFLSFHSFLFSFWSFFQSCNTFIDRNHCGKLLFGKMEPMEMENGPPPDYYYSIIIRSAKLLQFQARRESKKLSNKKRIVWLFRVVFVGQQNAVRQTKPKDWTLNNDAKFWYVVSNYFRNL